MDAYNKNQEDQIGINADIKSLIDLLGVCESKEREKVIMSLVEMGEVSVHYLIESLRDMDKWYDAVEALVRIGQPSISLLIETLSDPIVDTFAYKALRRIGEPAVLPLIYTLQDVDTGKRFWAAEALGEIRDKRAIEPLTNLLKDDDAQIRANAMEALEKLEAV